MSRARGAVGIVDRLVLTDEAAQFTRERARARFQRRVFHHFVRLHGERGAGEGGEQGEL